MKWAKILLKKTQKIYKKKIQKQKNWITYVWTYEGNKKKIMDSYNVRFNVKIKHKII